MRIYGEAPPPCYVQWMHRPALQLAGIAAELRSACGAQHDRVTQMDRTHITAANIATRSRWIERIGRASGSFAADARDLEKELADEIGRGGSAALIGHLRLCGAIPEAYAYDSSAEKLYAKYTDVVIHEAFKALGLLEGACGRTREDHAPVSAGCHPRSALQSKAGHSHSRRRVGV